MLKINADTSEILKDIMCQLPMDNYALFIGKLPDGFFQLREADRQTILKEVRRRIVRDGQKDPEELAEIVRQNIGQLINHPVNY